MKTKFLLINAIDPTREIEASLPPLGLGYLASVLREEFGDNIRFKIIDNNIRQEIKRFKPDVVGITSVSQNYNRAIRYARIAKEQKLPVIMGGVHITCLPLSLSKEMDIGIIGEGEKTIVDLFNLYFKKKHFDKKELKKIAGIAFWDKGKLAITQKRKVIEPLDKIPFPARDLMKIEKSTSMFTSRGCPYKCSFCASSCLWNQLRFFSAKYVVQEIKFLFEKYQVEYIEFWDDLFIADRKRLKRIIKLLKEEGLLGKIGFGCNTRANLIDKELAQLLKEMNFQNACMGLESASPRILRYLKGASIKVSDHPKAIQRLRQVNIKPHATFIIGSPMETKKEILKTLDFIKKSQLHDFDVYVLTPFPGTLVWQYAKKRNLVSEDIDWSALDVDFARSHEKAIILSEKLSRQEIYQLFLEFIKEKKMRVWKRLLFKALKNPLKVPLAAVKLTVKRLSS